MEERREIPELSLEIGLRQTLNDQSAGDLLQQYHHAHDRASRLQRQLEAAEADKAELQFELGQARATCSLLQAANTSLQAQMQTLQGICASFAASPQQLLGSSQGSVRHSDRCLAAGQQHAGPQQKSHVSSNADPMSDTQLAQPVPQQMSHTSSNADSMSDSNPDSAVICPSWPPIEKITTFTWVPDMLDSDPASPASAQLPGSDDICPKPW